MALAATDGGLFLHLVVVVVLMMVLMVRRRCRLQWSCSIYAESVRSGVFEIKNNKRRANALKHTYTNTEREALLSTL